MTCYFPIFNLGDPENDFRKGDSSNGKQDSVSDYSKREGTC